MHELSVAFMRQSESSGRSLEEKHEYLRSLGVKFITSSRNGVKFEADMQKFLEQDGADGVDVVLNSLSHDDYIPRSLSLLRKGGRFIEIGKRGVWSHQYEAQIPNVGSLEEDPQRFGLILGYPLTDRFGLLRQMWEARSDVMYEKIAADTMMEKESWRRCPSQSNESNGCHVVLLLCRYNAYLKRLLSRVEAGALRPIHMHIFDGLEKGPGMPKLAALTLI